VDCHVDDVVGRRGSPLKARLGGAGSDQKEVSRAGDGIREEFGHTTLPNVRCGGTGCWSRRPPARRPLTKRG
jgi:hypothetical protein